jgi:hypothetical protein
MKRLILLLLVVTFLGCKSGENSCGQAFIGGEIINPNKDFLVLKKDTLPIDTLYLDENNRFAYHIESLDPGLHSIVHGDEYQIIILEPNDSLMVRLNTLDFDESLVFSGMGSKKNNYLINLFLEMEEEEGIIYKYWKLKPTDFLQKMDSLREIKLHQLDKFSNKHMASDFFVKVVEAGVDYSHYSHKELYPYRHFGMNKPLPKDSLPGSYFAFRNDVDYNDEELKDFYPYYAFLFNHFNNLASEKFFTETDSKYLDRMNINYHLNKLELIDEKISNEILKNILLKYLTRNFLSFCTSPEDAKILYDSYTKKNTSKENASYIQGLYNTLKRLGPGNKIPVVEVIDHANNVTTLNNLSSKPKVLYFWTSINKYHFKNSHNKVRELKKAYPNVDFIAININSNNAHVWKRLLKEHKIDYKKEFRFRDPQIAKKMLAIQYINKVIVLDGDNNIIASNANLFNHDFKYILNKLK